MKTLRRRRKENKTDYHKRISLLKGGIPRVTFRKTNRYIIAEYVTSKEAQDSVVFGVTSRILLNHGWPEDMQGSLKSLSAAYLTGFYLGKQIVHKKLETPIIDIGMIRNVNKGKVFAFIKGIVDSGVKAKHEEKTFPDEDRIKGKNLKRDFSVSFAKIKKDIEGAK